MSDADTEAAVVVGVGDGGHLSDGTIHFALDTAGRLGLGIELVHAVPLALGGPTVAYDVAIPFDELLRQGQADLDAAVAKVRSRASVSQPVSGALVRGGAVTTLLARSRHAQLVVLERRRLGRWERFAEGSVTTSVAARAHCPVVSVPSGWRPPRRPQPVTVGVEDAARADAELWTALGLAAATDVPVQVVRAVYVAEAYQEILRRELDTDDLLRAARAQLALDAHLPESVCEKVPCTFYVRWGKPAEVLVDASAGSSLLVVARRDPRLPFGSHLGPVVRQVLRESECPVLVVEPRLDREALGSDRVDERPRHAAATG